MIRALTFLRPGDLDRGADRLGADDGPGLEEGHRLRVRDVERKGVDASVLAVQEVRPAAAQLQLRQRCAARELGAEVHDEGGLGQLDDGIEARDGGVQLAAQRRRLLGIGPERLRLGEARLGLG